MSTILFANNAATTLASNVPNSSVTTISVVSATLFPNPTAGQYFLVTIIPALTGIPGEIMQVTGVSGTTFTVVRGVEGTTASTWTAGDAVANLITAGTMSAFIQSATTNPVRIVSGSGPLTVTTADLNGTIGLINSGARSFTLPTGVAAGTYTIVDLASNFNVNPVTVTYPATQPGPGTGGATTAAVLNINKSRTTFSYLGPGGAGNNQWGGP
jgi:hypothetical protein